MMAAAGEWVAVSDVKILQVKKEEIPA